MDSLPPVPVAPPFADAAAERVAAVRSTAERIADKGHAAERASAARTGTERTAAERAATEREEADSREAALAHRTVALHEIGPERGRRRPHVRMRDRRESFLIRYPSSALLQRRWRRDVGCA